MVDTAAKTKANRKGLAIAAMVLGIVALVFFIWGFLSIPLAILAIIFGAVSIRSSDRGKALAGFITGIVALILSLLVIIVAFAALPSLQRSQRDTLRKNDISELNRQIINFQGNNRGQLPAAANLDTATVSAIDTITEGGIPTETSAAYVTGEDCEGASDPNGYAISMLLEDGSPYCLDAN
jgi:type II secretory pathway pseudopilin PulG